MYPRVAGGYAAAAYFGGVSPAGWEVPVWGLPNAVKAATEAMYPPSYVLRRLRQTGFGSAGCLLWHEPFPVRSFRWYCAVAVGSGVCEMNKLKLFVAMIAVFCAWLLLLLLAAGTVWIGVGLVA